MHLNQQLSRMQLIFIERFLCVRIYVNKILLHLRLSCVVNNYNVENRKKKIDAY